MIQKTMSFPAEQNDQIRAEFNRDRSYPIPVHCELKKPNKGKLSPSQEIERARIKKSGSIFIVVRTPEELHNFFLEHGLNKVQPRLIKPPEDDSEGEISRYTRAYLRQAEKIYGLYWERNNQNVIGRKGRPDFYFEIPSITEN